jgi:hypothetical protein
MKLMIFALAVWCTLGAFNKGLQANTTIIVPENAVKGDFNGDGKPEYAWLKPPELAKDELSCIGNCTAYIMFSDTSIKPIKVDDCIGGKPDNLGDLNNDGKDEIGLLPEWFASCWRNYKVYTFKDKTWQYAVPPIATHCNQWEDSVKVIEKDLAKKGNVIIRYSAFDKKEIVTKTKSIPIE